MENLLIIGFIGAIFLIAAWAISTLEAIERHKSLIDLKFASITLIGIIFLIIYSWLRKDSVFFILNIVLLSIVIVEIVATMSIKKIHKRRRR